MREPKRHRIREVDIMYAVSLEEMMWAKVRDIQRDAGSGRSSVEKRILAKERLRRQKRRKGV